MTGFSKSFDTPAIDPGAFVLPRAVFLAERLTSDAGDASLAGAISALAATCPLEAVSLTPDGWCIDVDTPEDAGERGWRFGGRSPEHPTGQSPDT